MAHVRKQIRDAVIVKVTGLVTTGTNVFASRDLPLENAADIPGLCVYTRSDVVNYEDGVLTCMPFRELELVVDGFYSAGDDDDLDTIAAEVETAIYADPTFGGLAHGMELGDQLIEVDAEGDRAVGRINMTFRIFYRVAEGFPEVAA